jgi:hypothetical protein
VILVDDGDAGVGLNHAGGDGAGFLGDDAHFLLFVGVELHDQALDVEDDVGDILADAADAGKLVVGAFDFHLADGGAFKRRKQDAPQAVADGGAKAALKGLGGELAIGVRGDLLVAGNARGKLQTTPSNSHVCSLRRRRIAEGYRPNR